MGLPSTVLITTPFQTLARNTAMNAGQPDFAPVVVEHPVWTRDDAWIEAAAEKLIDSLLATLMPAGTGRAHSADRRAVS